MQDLLTRLEATSPLQITEDQLRALLAAAELRREESTGLAGKIRVLGMGGVVLVQERTPDRTILLRRRQDLAAAEGFLEERLRIYDRMWDG